MKRFYRARKKKREFSSVPHQILLVMKLMVLFLTVASLSVSARSFSQTITWSGKDVPLEKVFSEIEQQTGYVFFYNDADMIKSRPVTLSLKDADLKSALREILKNQMLTYSMEGKTIFIHAEPGESFLPVNPNITVQQLNPVRGTVIDADTKRPLIGVTVQIKGTSTGTTTGEKGEFNLSVPDNAVLIFSYVGYQQKEVTVNGRTEINVIMEASVSALNQLVVVGYGTEKKVDLTGAISTISGKEIENRQAGQTTSLLQGMAPGVTVTQSTGQPGLSGGTIRIGGIGTLNDADPLVLVDGVQMDMNSINPNSIQSISILKDAAASAIYGSMAANGVILITTKRGSKGLTVSYNSYIGFQRATDLPQKVNAIQHMTLLNESYTNAGLSPLFSQDYIKNYNANHASNPYLYPETDWDKAILTGNGVQTNQYVSVSGGSDRFKIFGALGYLHQNGLVKPTTYERYFFRMNTDVELSKKLSGSFDIYVFNSKRNDVAPYNSISSNGSGIGLIWGMMNKLPAVWGIKNKNGSWAPGQNGENPVAILQDGGFFNETMTPIEGNFSLKYQPFDFLTAKITFSPSYSQPEDNSFVNVINTYNPDGTPAFSLPAKNYLNNSITNNRFDQFYGTLTFAKNINQNFIKALGGYQYESSSTSGFNAFRDGFLFPQYTVLSAGSVNNMQNSGSATAWALLSYFGRVNYNYADKYMFEANMRYDGSSRFAGGHKWGVFPSFSAGWRISGEKFMNGIKGVINNLKIRGSWGRLGNQNIGGDYPFASTITIGTNYISNDQLQNGAAITQLANPDISWEATTMSDIGVDFTLLKNLTGSFDYYYKKTTGILLQLNIPLTMGVAPPYQNAGIVRNKGWGFQADYKNDIGNLNYDIRATLSNVNNKILSMKGISQNGLIVDHQGYPINSLFLLKAIGLISSKDMNSSGNYTGASQFGNVQPGDIKYEDYNHDGIINSADQRVLGSTIPQYTYSVNISLQYKSFDFTGFLQGVGKVDGYLSSNTIFPFFSGGTAFTDMLNRWTIQNFNPHAMFPRLVFDGTNNTQNSTFWMKSAAYLRVKDLQLGYTIPSGVTNRIGIKMLRVYISGDNIFTFTKFWPGWDPEIPAGSNGFYYPQVKSYNVGLNVTF